MNRHRIAAVAFAWVLSLLAVGVWAQGIPAVIQVPAQPDGLPEAAPTFVTGGDIGFQLVQDSGGRRVSGKLMVRLNGRWVEARLAVTAIPVR